MFILDYNFFKICPYKKKGGDQVEVLRVSAKSEPSKVAGRLADILNLKGRAEIHIIGAGALNQAIKAVAITNYFIQPNGLISTCVPALFETEVHGEKKTAISLFVERKEIGQC